MCIVHAFYSGDAPSGEDQAVQDQVHQLEKLGFNVSVVHPDDSGPPGSISDLVRAGIRVATGFGANPLNVIRQQSPDIVHIHNLFPSWGTNWLWDLEIPFVVSLHNFRPICAQGSFMRNGRQCFDCIAGPAIVSIPRRCYRQSITATIPLGMQNALPISLRPLLKKASALIALSPESAEIYRSFLGEEMRVVEVPNFVPGVATQIDSPRDGWVWAGRMDSEKGIQDVIEHWPSNETIRILGSGTLESHIEKEARHNLQYWGRVPRAIVDDELKRARGHLFSSRMLENCPLIYLQALRAGTPTLSRTDNVVGRDVQRWKTGVAIDDFSRLSDAIQEVEDCFEEFSQNAISLFSEQYSDKAWSKKIINLYEEVLSGDLV